MEDFNIGFAARMQEVVEILGSVSELSRRVEVAYPTASKWVKEGAEPSTTNLIKIAEVANVNLLWLATGKGPKSDEDEEKATVELHSAIADSVSELSETMPVYATKHASVNVNAYAFIPMYSISDDFESKSFGDGKVLCTVAFNRSWLENYLNVESLKLSTLIVKDDSMTGVLNDGDHVLINHAKKAGGDGLYVLRMGKNVMIKRTQLLPNNKLLITSANSAYESFTVDLSGDENNEIEVIGKIEWFGRKI
ncbi:MAG: helix-turn-helix transcriptional regulator [Snodgrassella sp.]|nr:helix-turn-helix transcriptional regulator [Snodgrassella sp.]